MRQPQYSLALKNTSNHLNQKAMKRFLHQSTAQRLKIVGECLYNMLEYIWVFIKILEVKLHKRKAVSHN